MVSFYYGYTTSWHFLKPLPIAGRHLHWNSSDAEDDEDDDEEDEELSSGGGAWHQQIQYGNLQSDGDFFLIWYASG